MELEYTSPNHASGWVHSKALWSFELDPISIGFIGEDRVHKAPRIDVWFKWGNLTEIGDNVTGYANYGPYQAQQFLAFVNWREVGPFDLEKDIWDTRGE